MLCEAHITAHRPSALVPYPPGLRHSPVLTLDGSRAKFTVSIPCLVTSFLTNFGGDGSRSATQERIDPQSRLNQPVTVIKGVQVPPSQIISRPLSSSPSTTNQSFSHQKETNQSDSSLNPSGLSGWSPCPNPIRRISIFRNKHLGNPRSCSRSGASQSEKSILD